MHFSTSSLVISVLSFGVVTRAVDLSPSAASAAAAGASATPEPGALEKTFNVGKTIAKNYFIGATIDLTDRDEADAREGNIRLTDDNYEKEVKAWDGDWIAVVHSKPNEPVPRAFVDTHFNASNLAADFLSGKPDVPGAGEFDDGQKKERLEKIKWARIDFMTEWKTCARWSIIKPPYLVFISDHGDSVRFLSSGAIRPNGTNLYRYAAAGEWKKIEPWTGLFSPSGALSPVVEAYIAGMGYFSEKTKGIPSIVWVIGSGYVVQMAMKFLFTPQGLATGNAPRPGTGPAGAAGARRRPVDPRIVRPAPKK